MAIQWSDSEEPSLNELQQLHRVLQLLDGSPSETVIERVVDGTNSHHPFTCRKGRQFWPAFVAAARRAMELSEGDTR